MAYSAWKTTKRRAMQRTMETFGMADKVRTSIGRRSTKSVCTSRGGNSRAVTPCHPPHPQTTDEAMEEHTKQFNKMATDLNQASGVQQNRLPLSAIVIRDSERG